MENDNAIYCLIISEMIVPRKKLLAANSAIICSKTRIGLRMSFFNFLHPLLKGILRRRLCAAVSLAYGKIPRAVRNPRISKLQQRITCSIRTGRTAYTKQSFR